MWRRGLLIGGGGESEKEEVDEVSSISTSCLPSSSVASVVAEAESSTSTRSPGAELSGSSTEDTVTRLGISLMVEGGAPILQNGLSHTFPDY